MNKKDFEIIICGAGLVGMTLALLLSKEQINVLLIDKNNKNSFLNPRDARTTAISQGSSRIYKNLGMWDKLLKNAQQINSILVSEGVQSNDLDFDNRKVGEGPLGFIIDNKILKKALFKEIIKSKFVDFSQNTEVVKINNEERSLEVNKKKRINYKLLLAADGRFSKIRFHAGVKYFYHDYHQNAFVFNITHSNPHNGIALERFFSTGPLALLPMKDKKQRKSSVVWTVDSNISNQKSFNQNIKEEFSKRYKKFFGDIINFSKFQKYPLNVFSCYNSCKKNIIFVGDASQAIHPIAGQGFNLGLRDAFCVSQMITEFKELGLEVNNKNLMDAYERKRFIDKTALVSVTHNLNKLFSNNSFTIKLIRRLGLRIFSESNYLKNQSMIYAMGLKNLEL